MSKRKWTDAEVMEYRKTHKTFFYFNREDANLSVPKKYGYGRTMNFANPIAWILLAALVGFIVYRVVTQ